MIVSRICKNCCGDYCEEISVERASKLKDNELECPGCGSKESIPTMMNIREEDGPTIWGIKSKKMDG